MSTAKEETQDISDLHELNLGYVRAAQDSDVRWYAGHLDEAYMCSNPDGSLVDRAGFLARIARPNPGARFESVDARIRIIEGIGIIQSGFRLARADGSHGAGCYTDVWARATGRWLCISAHFALFDVPMSSAAMTHYPQHASAKDLETLDALNREYIRSVRDSDIGWFDSNLDPDFFNSNPDGSVRETLNKSSAALS